MELKKLLLPHLIKILTIKDGVLKIEKFDGSIKEIEISEIRKIHIVNSQKKYKLINLVTIIAVLLSIFYFNNIKKFLLLMGIISSICLFYIVFEKNKAKILYIKLQNKTTYLFKFNTKIKDLVLSVIWEIRKKNNF